MTSAQQFKRLGDGLKVLAPAKLNLSLLIAGKRPDGFHEIETVMAKIDWYDELLIEPGARSGIELACQGPQWAPTGPGNLVCRAAERILRRCGRSARLRLTLTKNVPAGSGLGSASSDAAATLMGLNEYLDLRLSAADLMKTAAEIGSDVAFFLDGPLALCTGKGEKITPLAGEFNFTALLVTPSISVSTEKIYRNYTHDPARYERLSGPIAAYLKKNRIDLVAKMCANMLSETCFHLFEELGRLKETIESLGLGPICLSGSGSTLFSILDDHDMERLEPVRDEITEKACCESIVVRNCRL